MNEKGEKQTGRIEGYDARCYLHELDHLLGITYKDRASKLKWDMATKRATPTIVAYDDSGNSGKCKRINYGVTATANEAVVTLNIGDTCFDPVSYSGSAASGLLLHFTADAEL